MKIVTTTTVFDATYPCDKAIERLAAVGFDGMDMGFDYLDRVQDSPMWGSEWREFATKLRNKARKNGIEYTHAHAPFHGNDFSRLPLCIEAASILGAKYIVVHPTEWEQDGAAVNGPEEFIRRNAELAYSWLEFAEKCGVVILSENLLEGNSGDPHNVALLVKEVGSEYFGWCFDTGHAHLCGFRPEQLTECAAAPLSLHLQDNHGKSDEHLIPGDGMIDFDAIVRALKEFGYSGDCVLEAHKQSLTAPNDERDAILLRLLMAGESIREKFGN